MRSFKRMHLSLGVRVGCVSGVGRGCFSWVAFLAIDAYVGRGVCEGVVFGIVLSVEIDIREGIEDAVVSEGVGSGVRGFSGREAGFSAWGWGLPLQRQAS